MLTNFSWIAYHWV